MDMSEQFPMMATPEQQDAPVGEASMNRAMRRALVAVGVLVFGLGLGAAVIPMGGAVIASGHVAVSSQVKRVTHPNGGVIAQLFVHNGDHVRAGDPLLRFDDSVTGGQSELAALSVDQLLAQRARLQAEQLGLDQIRFPDELQRNASAEARQAMSDEARLFHLRQAEQSALHAQLNARVQQFRRQIAGYNAQISAYQQQSRLIAPELAGVKELWDKGLVTISRKNELERTAVDLRGNVGSLEANIAQASARITETQEQAIQLGQTRRAEAGAQLAALNNTLNDQKLRSLSAGDAQDRSVVRASYAGVVDKLAFVASGDVVRPAEPILEIVPDNDELIVEAALSPADVEQVTKGQSARIRFTSLNSTATPEIPGKVIFVAADQSVDPKQNTAFFPVRIAFTRETLKEHPEIRLRPGMPAEAFIETGSRSMLSYLLKPLRDQFARAFLDN